MKPLPRLRLVCTCVHVAHIILDDNCSRIFGFIQRFPPKIYTHISLHCAAAAAALQTFLVSLLRFDSLFTNFVSWAEAGGDGEGGGPVPLRLAAPCGLFPAPTWVGGIVALVIGGELPNYVGGKATQVQMWTLPRQREQGAAHTQKTALRRLIWFKVIKILISIRAARSPMDNCQGCCLISRKIRSRLRGKND